MIQRLTTQLSEEHLLHEEALRKLAAKKEVCGAPVTVVLGGM